MFAGLARSFSRSNEEVVDFGTLGDRIEDKTTRILLLLLVILLLLLLSVGVDPVCFSALICGIVRYR